MFEMGTFCTFCWSIPGKQGLLYQHNHLRCGTSTVRDNKTYLMTVYWKVAEKVVLILVGDFYLQWIKLLASLSLAFWKKTQGDFLGVLALRYLLSLEIPLLKNSPLCYSLHTQKSLYIMWTNQRKLFIILHYLSTFLPGPFPHFEYKSPLIYSFVTLYICNLNFHLYPPHSILSMRSTLNCLMPHIPERIIRLCVHTTQLSLWYHWKEASLANYRSCSTGVTVTNVIL